MYDASELGMCVMVFPVGCELKSYKDLLSTFDVTSVLWKIVFLLLKCPFVAWGKTKRKKLSKLTLK